MKLKGSFSVEAAWIFGISMIVIYLMIALSFDLYSSVSEDISNTKISDIEIVRDFRIIHMGKDLILE